MHLPLCSTCTVTRKSLLPFRTYKNNSVINLLLIPFKSNIKVVAISPTHVFIKGCTRMMWPVHYSINPASRDAAQQRIPADISLDYP